MCKWTWVGCILLAAVVAPARGEEDSVEITIRGRLTVSDGSGPTTITVGEGEVARSFSLVLPDDPGLRETARSLNGKPTVVVGMWERKLATLYGPARITPSTRVVWVNGVEKVVPVSGKAYWVVQKKVVEFVRAKSLSAASLRVDQPVMPMADAGKP